MHDPVGLGAAGRLPSVKNQGLLHTHDLVLVLVSSGEDRLVDPGRLPEPRDGRPVHPVPVQVLGFLGAEEVPLLLTITCKSNKS